jgi:hypothetical protein
MPNARSADHYIVGASMMAFGGRGIHVSIVHISNLFVGRRYVVLSALTGSVSLSFGVFGAFDWLWRRDPTEAVSLHRLFTLYTGVVVASMVVSCFVWPDEKYPPPSCDGQNVDVDHDETTTSEGYDGIATQPLRLCPRQEKFDAETSRLVCSASNHSAYNSLQGSGFGDRKEAPFAQQFCSASYLCCSWSSRHLCKLLRGILLHRGESKPDAKQCR